MARRRVYRLIFGVLVVASALVLVDAHLQAAAGNPGQGEEAAPDYEVPAADGITVIATDSNVWLPEEGDGPRQRAELVAFDADGDVLYYNATHDRYWDVDPVEGESTTVVYAASDHLNRSECEARSVCTRNLVERVNLSTGETTVLYSRITPHKHSTRWHDVDRLDDGRLLVADIYRDRVFAVDPATGVVDWAWEAQAAYGVEGGGPYPRDWTHLNDVEVLPDGSIMVSLRNQDQVVFLDPETGLQEEWTLGDDDDHDVLFEQHNPDFIPADRGGPAVLVADSENNRVVEYQRVDGEAGNASANGSRSGDWNRTWTWTDASMQWPRDADRLPNGNTLITDSNGDRVLEVDQDGEVVWSVEIGFPYEAERLGTGDESAGGHSARELGLQSRDAATVRTGDTSTGGPATVVWLAVKQTVPGPLLNSVVYALPGWVSPREAVALVVFVSSLVAWVVFEWRQSEYSLQVRSPVVFHRE